MPYSIIPAEPAHVSLLAESIREADRAEVEATGITPRRALWRSLRRSTIARTAFVDGEIAAMWGAGGSPLGTIGRPWLLTTPVVERVPLTFLRVTRAEVGMMLETYPRLLGLVDARYHRALRLLEVCGFSVGEPVTIGPCGALFRWYEMRRG